MTQNIITEVVGTAKRIAKRTTQLFPEAASPGDTFRQGDVYITLLGALPAGCERLPKWDLQMAPGDTQGSRHILDAKAGVTCYRLPSPSEFDGPVLVLKKEREITHPEHGHVILPPGIYGISYQRTQDAMDEQRRVAD